VFTTALLANGADAQDAVISAELVLSGDRGDHERFRKNR